MNSRISWSPYRKSDSEVLAHYLVALFRSEYNEPSRQLLFFGHFIKILIPLRIVALLGQKTLSQSPKSLRITWPLFSGQTSFNSRITRLFVYLYQSLRPSNLRISWPHNFKSVSVELAHYLATLYKNSVLLRIFALLGHIS